MKRAQQSRSNQANHNPRLVDARRLAEARGGEDLGIALTGGRSVAADYMSLQHNEALIRI